METLDLAAVGHDPYGPSQLYKRFLCPGSEKQESLCPEIKSEYAEEGTRLHRVLAAIIRTGPCPDELVDEDRELIDPCLDFLRVHLEMWPDKAIMTEVPLTLTHNGIIIQRGTADVAQVGGDTVIGVDWKFGWEWPSQAELTFQGSSYGCGAAQKVGRKRAVWFFFMPRRNEWRVVEVDDVEGTIETIAKVIDKSLRAPASFLRSGAHCQYCRALPVCPRVEGDGLDLESAVLPAPVSLDTPAKKLEEMMTAEVRMWDDKKLSAYGERIEVIEKACKAWRTVAKERSIETPGSVEGWEAKDKDGKRTADTWRLWQAMMPHLTAQEFLSCVSASVAQCEKVFAKKYAKEMEEGTEKEGREEFKTLTDDIVTSTRAKELRKVKR